VIVEIHRRTTRRVKARQPHGAQKHDSQRVVGALKFLVQRRLRLIHPLAVRHDVEAVLFHLLNLVLAGRHDERHVHCLQNLQPVLQFGLNKTNYGFFS
jgi:hypothetical protein